MVGDGGIAFCKGRRRVLIQATPLCAALLGCAVLGTTPARAVDGMWVAAPATNAGFITLPVTNFTVFGPSAALVDLGSKLVLKPNAALFASFDGEFSDRSQMYAGKGGLKVTW